MQCRSCMHEAGTERFRPMCRGSLALASGAAFVLVAAAHAAAI